MNAWKSSTKRSLLALIIASMMTIVCSDFVVPVSIHGDLELENDNDGGNNTTKSSSTADSGVGGLRGGGGGRGSSSDVDQRLSTEALYEAFLNDNKDTPVLVKFCNAKAGICKELNAEWDTFAAAVKNENIPLAVTSIDCSVNKENGRDSFCIDKRVRSYPLFRFIDRSRAMEEDVYGRKKSPDLMEIAREYLGLPSSSTAANGGGEFEVEGSSSSLTGLRKTRFSAVLE